MDINRPAHTEEEDEEEEQIAGCYIGKWLIMRLPMENRPRAEATFEVYLSMWCARGARHTICREREWPSIGIFIPYKD